MLKVRVPEWCAESTMEVLAPGQRDMKRETGGYWTVTREWQKGDRVELRFKLEPRVVVGDHKNQGKVAVLYGPLVLAADEALLGATNRSLKAISAAGTNLAALDVTPEPAPDAVKSWPGAQVFRVNALARKSTGSLKAGRPAANPLGAVCGRRSERNLLQSVASARAWPRPAETSCSTARRVVPA